MENKELSPGDKQLIVIKNKLIKYLIDHSDEHIEHLILAKLLKEAKWDLQPDYIDIKLASEERWPAYKTVSHLLVGILNTLFGQKIGFLIRSPYGHSDRDEKLLIINKALVWNEIFLTEFYNIKEETDGK